MIDAEYREQMKQMIDKQPSFDNKEIAIAETLKRDKYPDAYNLWQEPNNGKYIVAEAETWNALYHLGYTQVLTDNELADLHQKHIDEIEEV